jgi:uncharacterized protein involved in exopolysaccharide biosynthesis
MEVATLKRALQRHWLAALVTFAVVSVITVLATVLPQQRYESTSVLSVQPLNRNVSTGMIEFLIPSLEARVDGPSLRADVAASLPPDLRGSTWAVGTVVPAGSGVLRITVTSPDPDVPGPAANAYAEILANEEFGMQAVDVLVIDPASTASTTSPGTTVLVSGFGLAVILALLVAFGLHAWTQRPLPNSGHISAVAPRTPAAVVAASPRRQVRDGALHQE